MEGIIERYELKCDLDYHHDDSARSRQIQAKLWMVVQFTQGKLDSISEEIMYMTRVHSLIIDKGNETSSAISYVIADMIPSTVQDDDVYND